MAAIKGWRELIACRLCWKIALAVFTLILAIESVILVPSAQRFEAGMLKQAVDHAIIAVEPTLAAADYGGRAAALATGIASAVGRYGILGALVESADGRNLVRAGSTDALEHQLAFAAPMGEGSRRSPDGAHLDVAWPTVGGVKVAVRVDTSRVTGEVVAYTLRIAGLVAIIVLVVTAGTMLVLDRWVLRALLRLRESSIAAGADPDNAQVYAVRAQGRDELGDLMRAHNAMLDRVAQSKRRDRELAEEKARYASRHHEVTGLPNRAALIEHLDRLSRDAAPCVTLYALKLLDFGPASVSFAAVRGNDLSRQIASRLRHVTDAGDFVAQVGAHRFAVARSGERCAAAAAPFAETLLRDAAAGYDLEGAGVVSVAARLGIAQSAGRAFTGESLQVEAELALERARAVDGARYEFFAPEIAAEARERQSLTRDLERALEANELYLVAQPKLTLLPEGGVRLSGAEVLVRWKHPARGMVRPDAFIPLAESTGLIVPIGDFVLRAAARAARGWLDRHGWAPPLAVNLSARQFADPALVAHLKGILDEARIPVNLLEIEITETAAMKDVLRTAATLRALRALGMKVAIDDFGTGYSSLNYLRRFAVDAVKIDKSFVEDIGTDPDAEAVCDAILRLGKSLRTKIVAEGVENDRQLEFLRRRRCEEVQGYLFGEPLPLEEFEQNWVAARAVA